MSGEIFPNEFADDNENHSENTSEPKYVRRVTLPSGKIIEVVYFDEPSKIDYDENDGLEFYTERIDQDLTICRNPNRPDCQSNLVYPVDWEEYGNTRWKVELRCPNCEWEHVDIYDQATVEMFDEQLDRGTNKVVRDLKRMIVTIRIDEADRLATAFSADAIDVQDIRDWNAEPYDAQYEDLNLLDDF